MKKPTIYALISLFFILSCTPNEQQDSQRLPIELATRQTLETQTEKPDSILANNLTNPQEDTPEQTNTNQQEEPTEDVLALKPQNGRYRFNWLKDGYSADDMLVNRVPPPQRYERTRVAPASFGDWLRNLPLKKGNPNVMLYNGSPKGNQSAHAAVFNVDVGNQDLQQCADAVMRLRSEYLYQASLFNQIQYNFTNGFTANYAKWRSGYRPVTKGNKTTWAKKPKTKGKSKPITAYDDFKLYLTDVFRYAGSLSLSKEMKPIDIADMHIGDVFIKGGTPGHAIIVVDMAQNPQTGEKLFLLAQSYMPAQDIQLLNNPNNNGLSPWYSADFGEELVTPEWTFGLVMLKTF